MKKISFSNLLKIVLLIVISLVYVGQVSADSTEANAMRIFISVGGYWPAENDIYEDLRMYTNDGEYYIGTPSNPLPDICPWEGDMYLTLWSRCEDGASPPYRYDTTEHADSPIYTISYDEDQNDCEICKNGTWIDSATSCGSPGCIGGKCCGDDGGSDDWCDTGSASTSTTGFCGSGSYAVASNEIYAAACWCNINDNMNSDLCDADGEGSCWDSSTIKCCGDDGLSDDWCGSDRDVVEAEFCLNGGYYIKNDDDNKYACECFINSGTFGDDECDLSNVGDVCWDVSESECCGNDGINDNWCDGTVGACVAGAYQINPSYSSVCNCQGGHDYWVTCFGLGAGAEDCWANNTNDCCYDANDNWCDGASGACVAGIYQADPGYSGVCNCLGGHNYVDTCQGLGAGAEDCWAGNINDCCYEASDDWCDGTAGACVGGTYQTDPITYSGACNCRGSHDYGVTCLGLGAGAEDCWANDTADCCYEASDNWCDGASGACVGGTYHTNPNAYAGVCNCQGGHDYYDTCQVLGDGAEDCWATDANDCCKDVNDNWCDGNSGACVGGIYQTNPESGQGACQCKGYHSYDGTCLDGQSTCWASNASDCCYEASDDWCDGNVGACVGGIYQTNPESGQGACQCTGGYSYSSTCSEDGQTGCWENLEGSMNCCDGTDTECDGTGNYAACIDGSYQTDGDFAEEICSCGGGYWDIGGEAIGPDDLCCGDDSLEGRLTRTAHSSMDNDYTTDATDDACCFAANKCVDDSNCYDSLSSYDADNDGDVDYCNAGIWQDCSSELQCPNGYQCVSYDCIACIPGTCGAGCIGHDSDGDGIIDYCDIEGSDDSTEDIEDKSYFNMPVDEECTDGVDNDGDGGCDYDGCLCTSDNNFCGTDDPWLIELYPNIGCTCTSCEECGGTWWDLNLCDETECQGCVGNCHFEEIIPGISSTCCPDSDLDGICDEDDICPGFNDSDDADGDTIPNGCDICGPESECNGQDCSNDDDNDCSPNNLDCYPGDPTKGEGDLSGETQPCGTDDCYSGIYYKFTDCEESCSNGELICNCTPPAFPYEGSDMDNDGYDDFCDGDYYNDPCSREFLGDNCGSQICLENPGNCSNACSGPDSDGDGIPDICDIYGDDSDNDGTPNSLDCFPDDPLIGEGDPCGTTVSCGTDGCYEGIYFDFTDCEETCGALIDRECGCECGLPAFPFDGLDADNDGYDDYCDFYPDDPCSTETQGDNCSIQACIDDLTSFCNNACPGDDADGDGAVDECDFDSSDPCSINLSVDNCGGQNCLEGSNSYCNTCSGPDSDGDAIIDACDIESSEQDCNDGIDNDGDGTCDLAGCDGMDPDQGCSELCGSCEECGAGIFDACTQTECEQSCGNNCYYSFGLGLFNDCCIDSDADTVCDIYDLCPDQDDRMDLDGDGMPDACDYCKNEPALTVPSEVQETSCIDGIDNDCDGLTDTDDDDCQCPGGTVRCGDGTCSEECEEALICNNNSICDAMESCNCEDCYFEQGSCSQGSICDPETGLCSDEPDLSPQLCENYDPTALQGACSLGETNCWASEIPPDYIVIEGSRCCGDDPKETWVYESNIDLEHVLVEYTCYEGKWRDLREVEITYYDVGVE